MTVIEVKKQINTTLEQVPEERLIDILNLLKEVQLDKNSNPTLISDLKKILSEDSDLLHKLAQ